jgi:hypothetical protein
MFRLSFSLGILLFGGTAGRGDESFRFTEAKHGKGELKYRHDVPILVVAGTPEEIGEQIGVLAIKPIAPRFNDVVKKHADALGPT